ncbi:MAG: O-methyltransferase [Solirubrobacterales bacterium]|nr:O-methyltransferase [Solirubrobacterales bacterium]
MIEPTAEGYALSRTTPFTGAAKDAADWTAKNAGEPQMMAGLAEARLLQALIVTGRAQRVLEIGTFTGVGALTIAEALPPGGHLTSLEVDPETAETARGHIAASPHAAKVEVLVGNAADTLARLPGPFDLVWIDADKRSYPDYFQAVRDKLSGHGVIAADNLFRDGDTLNTESTDRGTLAMRDFADSVREDPEFDSVLLTIGDGVLLAWRRPPG